MALQGFLLLYAMVITLEIGTSFARLEDLPCASSCTDSDKLSYQKGSRYTYKYSTETSTFLLESRSASSGVALDSLADIEVLHKCLMVLKLRNVQIKRTSTNKEEPSQDRLRESLEKSPLQFSFQDGKIPEICPSVDEPTWVLNIKRGVLSVFQNSHAASREETLEETDVSGRCLTSYEWKGPSLVKTRDLKRCSHRGLAVTSLDSVPLPDSAGQLLDSSLQCVQSYRDGVMEEASCTEVNLLIPFSRDAGGAQTKTLSTLKLLRVQEGLPTNRDDSREVYSSSLLYEREDGRETGTRASTAEQAAETVRKLCVTKGLHYEHADLFVSLVFQLRALSAEALGDLWQRASFRCRDNWQPLVDALPACSSEACVSLIAELLLSREMEEERATSFLTSLTFIPQPTAGMITTLTALLRSPEASRSVFLGVSSVVHTFCSAVQPACASVPEVLALMTVLRGYLEEDCGSGRNPEQLSQLQSVLKAVGNAGLAGAALTPALSRCAETQTGAVELRLAALDAFRRIPCSSDRSVLLRLYRSQEEDVEVRITAYLQAMRCPSEGLLQAVSQAQSEETSSQVGAFVWSHLSQLMETEDPLKRAVRDSLPDDIITKDFDAESWKFSSYTDATFQSGYGGANVEAAMVFSPKSFLPRSAMGNLTVHVLGRAINLLEVNIRAENIEPLAQRVFGRQPFDFGGDPVTEEGQRTKEDPTEAPLREKKKRNSERHTEEEAAETTQGPGRSRNRKAKQQGCQPGDYSKLSQIKDKFTEGVQKSAELRCGLSVKIFGNELSFLNCDDVKDQVKLLSLSLAEIALKLLKGQEVQYNRRLSLASEELTVPSLSGLPIRLAVNASAAISLRVKGAVDFKQWSNFFINGYIKPNALVRVSAWLGVEGQCGQAGLEWVSGLKTSTSLDGGVQVKRGQDLKVFLNTPEETMEIFDISSRLFLLSAEGREELSDPAERTVTASCTDQELSMLIGWQLCCEASYPTGTSAGPRPLPGPMSVSVRLKKLDRALQQYLFEAAYSFVSKKGSQIPSEAALHLFMGTPKSDVNRDLAIDVLFHHAQRRLSVKLVHPKKNVLIEGKIDVAKSMRSGKLELLLDDTDLYYIKGRTDLQTVAGEQRYLSQLEAKVTKQGNPIVLSGNATKLLGKKMKVSVALTNVLKDTASVLVLFEQKVDEWQRQYSLEAEAILPGLFGTHAVGMLQQKGPIWTTALRLRYGLLGDARSLHHECNIAQKLRRDGGLEDTYRLEAEHELYCSHITAYNHKVKLKHEESAAHTESTLHVSYGKHWDEINNKRRLLLSQTFKNRSKPALTNYFMEFSLQLPERQVSYRTQLQHTHLQQGHLESSTHLKVHYNDKMPFVAGLHWRDSSKPLLRKWEGSLNMDTPWLYLYAAHRLNQPQRHTYQTSSELTAGKAVSIKNLVMETFYKDKGKEKEGRIHVYTPTATYLKVSTSFHVGASVFRSASEVTSLWNQLLKNEIYLDNSAKSRSLLFKLKNPKQEFNITAALMVQEEKLKKRNVTLRMVLADHKSPPAVLHLLGQVEELRREKTLYQKRGTLHFRHPFKLLIPQNIVLHETFTVDTERKHYVLETRAVLDENEETVQTLTLGYQPENPYVCAGLVHPYSAEIVPKNTEVCIRTKTDQNSLYEAEATVRINKKDSLSVLGRYQNRSSKTEIWHGVQLNMTHLFQLKSSQALSLKSELFSKPTKTDWFSYGVTGKAIVNKHDVSQFNIQLNGSSNEVGLYSLFSHPYQSKIPHALQAYARVKLYGESNANGSLYLQSNGKDTAMLEVDLMNESKKNLRLIGAKVHLHQTLLPRFEDVYLQLTGEASASRVSLLSSVQLGDQALQVDLSGFKDQRAGLSASVSGRVQHNMESLPLLPPVLGLDGSLKHQDNLSEGDLTVKVSDALYEVKLWNRNVFVGGALQCDISTSLTQNGSAWGPARAKVEGRLGQGQVVGWSDGRLCVQAESRGLCLNLSSSLQPEHTGVKAELTHSVPEFSVAGLPSEGTLSVNYDQGALNRSGAVELRAGGRSLVARVEVGRMSVVSPRWQLLSSLNHDSEGLRRQGLPHSAQGTGYYQNGAAGLLAGLSVSVEKQHFNLELEKRSNDSAAQIAVSLSHHMGAISQVIPTALQRLQVNCSGEATADSLAAHCSGATASRPLEVRASFLKRPHGLCSNLELHYQRDSLRLEGCYNSKNKSDLAASLVHTSRYLQSLNIPTDSRLTAFLKQKPDRCVAVFNLSAGNSGLFTTGELLVKPSYKWRWLVSHSALSSSVPQETAEFWGFVRPERCNFFADIRASCSKAAATLNVRTKCRNSRSVHVKWAHITERTQKKPKRFSITLDAEAKKNMYTGIVGVENKQDSLSSSASFIMVKNKAVLNWTLLHKWKALERLSVPRSASLGGSVKVSNTSLEAGIQAALNGRPVHVDMVSVWGKRATVRVVFHHALPLWSKAGIPEDRQLTMAATFGHGDDLRLDVVSAPCNVSVRGSLSRGLMKKWSLTVLKQCPSFQNPALTRFSVNASMLSRDCTAHFMTRLETEGDRHAALSLHAACAPRHQLSVELGHSLPLLQALGVPTENKLALTAGSGALLDITLGQCSFRVRGDINMSASTDQQAQTGWAADWTNTCPMLQRAGLPHSLAAGASLSVGNCLSNLTVNLQFDGKAAGLQLDAACEPRYGLHGVFRHSIPLLYQQGLPQDSQLTVSAARGPRAGGTVLLQAGKCRIRASGDLKPGKRSEWTWATETTCQLIKGVTLPAHSQFNGSVALDGCRAELLADMLLDGDSASLELRSDCSPRLSLEGVFRHSMPTMQGVPLENRLLVTAGKQTVRYEASVELASGTCELQASGDLQLENIIQWKFLMENKCKRLQDLGTPVKAGGSGFFVLNRVNLDSRMLINIDEARLQGHLTLKAIDFKQELEATLTHNVQAVAGIGIPGSMVLAVTSERSGDIYKRFIKLSVDSKQITEELSIVRKLDQMTASYLLSHNVDTLRTWIIDDRTELQAKLDWKEVKVFTLHSQCGARLAILRVQVKNTPMRNDITASFRHTWPHLLESGLPGSAEVLCYLQGSVPNIESSARITVSGDRSISYTLNMSTPGLRHFHFLFRNTHNSQSLQAAGYPKTLETAFTLQNQDPKIKTALEVQVDGKHVKVWVSAVESLQRDSPLEVSAELQHSAPLLKQLGLPLHLKVEGWGQARDADLDGSLKLSCEPNSSFIVMVEGKNQLLSKVLRVKAMHNIPMVRHYLPHSFDINTKLNYSSNDIKGKVDLILDRRDLHVTAALTMRESGYEEVLEISHTFPQLKFVPKSVEVTTSFQRNSNTHTLHHVTLWEGKELKLTATYTGQFLKGSGAPELQVEISHPFFIQWPRQSTLHVHMDHAVHSHLDKIVLGWSGKDQVVLLCSLNYGKGRVESRVTLRHPFRLALWHLEFQYNSEGQAGRYTHETQVSWNEGLPVGVRISLQDQSVTNATVWDTCVTLSPGQLQSALALVALQGCGSVSRGESSFTETLELEWDTKKIRQSLKHQKSSKAGADILQLDLFLENIFQTSCSNQRIEGRVETNYRYQLEHHLNLGLCHPHTLITVSGKHHVSRGELLLRSETRVSVSSSGQEDSHSALIVTARNHGSPGVKNYSIEVELQGCADVQLVLAGKLTSSLLQNHILLVGSLDHRDRVTLWVLRDSRCLQAFAGYTNGEVGEDGLELSVCSEGQRQFEVDVSRCVDRVKQGTLGHVSLSLVNGSLNLWAQGSREGLQTAEARLAEVSSQLKTRLLDKSRQLESKLLELRRDVQHTDLLLELSGYPLRLTQAAGRLVENSGRAGSPAWGQSWLRDALTQGLPRYLQRIQKTLQQMQDELKRPLGTLKDAYQDVTLRALDEVWREWVHEVLGGLESRLPVLIKEVWLRQHIHGALQLLTRGLDTAAQQVLKWTDTKLSRAVSRIRKSLAELYRYTASNGTVAVRLPVLPGGDAELSLSNITAFLLEERLMRPLRELGSLSPAAEYYRLKRRMMESPFEHHAVLIEGRFVVSFDGKVFEVAGKCSAVLAQDFTRDSFTVLLRQEPGGRRSLHLEMNQTAVTILPGPRVEVACSPADLPLVKNGVTVRKDGNQITMTNQNGVTVSCDKHHSFCTLTLSGWQHGVSAGLFGTNDNEAANEFTQPDHSHTDSIPHFIQSWQVGSQCRSNSKKPKSCPAAVSQHTCKALFRDAYSPLRNCFRVVDPAPFYKLCISSTCRPNADRTSCSLTAAFVHLCNRNLVPLDIPSKCDAAWGRKQGEGMGGSLS
ncbi:uncharacterized protein LOC121326918 isoform X2 [Polyodon spathula]|uniref:uncharacterized protein LOC121326918 isoform X2 n=1 Tax=Polyodon spathula TaxID=7913 RepID=UPI001B7EFFC3|nr:uncharacterized protein LOC121326918 isoform X2 [Polyodon spathula]